MPPTRSDRKTRIRAHRRKVIGLTLALAIAGLLAIGALVTTGILPGGRGIAWFGPSGDSARASSPRAGNPTTLAGAFAARDAAAESSASLVDGVAPMSDETTLIEVPDMVDKPLSDAQELLRAAGLRLAVESVLNGVSVDSPREPPESGAWPASSTLVAAQSPLAGTIVAAQTTVTLSFASPAPRAETAPAKAVASNGLVVCIDPGHQAHSNTSLEPIGPGASAMKPMVTGGATGIVTRVPEYEVDLQIAINVQSRLEDAGVKVVMTRTTNDVNLSNAQRAQIANRAKAALFLRIHANSSTDESPAGVSTLYPGRTKWTSKTCVPGKDAASLVQRSVLAATGAPSDGVVARTDLAGFNWCTQPSVLVECGYLSNPVEDKLLTSPAYQDKLAEGIVRGVIEFLGR